MRESGETTREAARWFIPGRLGEERGRAPAADDRVAMPPDGSTSAKQATERSAGPRAARPAAFLTRAFSGLQGREGAEWGARNGLTPSLAFSHHLTAVFPPELYQRHPEFFPLLEGKRLEPPKGSGFWNPDIARPDVALYAANVARQYFGTHPADVSFALGVNDALIWGESPELRALAGAPTRWFRGRPDYSNVVFTFMNRAAADVSRTNPDKYLGCLAYYWCENVPDFPVHPRVIPFLTADRSQGYDGKFWREEMTLQEQWAGARAPSEQTADGGRRTPDNRVQTTDGGPQGGRRLGMYDYLYGGGFLIPRVHTRLLAENLRHARRVGFTDYYAEVNPNWGLDGPMPWLTAQLLQSPEQSREALLDEYYRRYFADSAEPMRRFFEKCEALWMAQPGPSYWLKHYRNESQAIVFPPAARGELRLLLMEAGVLATSRKVGQRVQLVSDAFGVTERFCAMYEARNNVIRPMLARTARASEREASGEGSGRADAGNSGGSESRRTSDARTPAADHRISELLSEFIEARRDFIRYTVALRREQPLALQQFLWDDYLKNDPLPLAVSVLQQNASGHRRRQLLENPAMLGPVKPGRTIAGLPYGVALPEPWQSKAEPAEFHRAELMAPAGRAATGEVTSIANQPRLGNQSEASVLRISGTMDTMVSQWVWIGAAPGGRVAASGVRAPSHVAEISMRGHVSPSNAVSLVLAWLDEKHRHVGFKTIRLPDGEWPELVTLVQAGTAPAGAVWVGLGLRVQNQMRSDWIEATDFSLKQ